VLVASVIVLGGFISLFRLADDKHKDFETQTPEHHPDIDCFEQLEQRTVNCRFALKIMQRGVGIFYWENLSTTLELVAFLLLVFYSGLFLPTTHVVFLLLTTKLVTKLLNFSYLHFNSVHNEK